MNGLGHPSESVITSTRGPGHHLGDRALARRAGVWMWDMSVPGDNDHNFYVDTSLEQFSPTTARRVLTPQNFMEPTNPPQDPPAEDKLPAGWHVRVMGPTEDYPNGYADGHYVDPSTMSQPGNVSKALFRAMTHVPLPGNGG